MRLFHAPNWLKTPNDRDVIARWTLGADDGKDAPPPSHRLELAADGPESSAAWDFLAVGDTGDADAAGPDDSPQDAVGREMARDTGTPVGPGTAQLVVHTGDVIYMTGERRLYDRNFRRPYAPFLTQGSTVDNLVFRLPFLPVPGNHDYYDLGSWAAWLSRVPLLGKGLRALAHELFAFGLPEGGSDMGRAYMEAFVDLTADTHAVALPYRPGESTRIPNRYYQFSAHNVDFFALDSNTLDAPPSETIDPAQMRQDATDRIDMLEKEAATLDAELRREQKRLEKQRTAQRRQIAADVARRDALAAQANDLMRNLVDLRGALLTPREGASLPVEASRLADRLQLAVRRWTEGTADLRRADSDAEVERAFRLLDDASDDISAALGALESLLADLEKGDPLRDGLLARRDALEHSQAAWAGAALPGGETLARIHLLSEEALDVQRELALARRREQYRPEDHDRAQLEWLDAALAASARDRPNAWRIVYLHHPLYTTVSNHCERRDVLGVRGNLLPILQRHDVHVVFAGHSHAFEWIRSSALPNAGIFVTGGGGQISLRPSLCEPKRVRRGRTYYNALRQAGVEECAFSGNGPAAADGASGLIYHYLRVSVTPTAITIHPVGVRRLNSRTYRREEPMPVFHAPYLSESRPPWESTRLQSVVIRRDAPPRARWK